MVNTMRMISESGKFAEVFDQGDHEAAANHLWNAMGEYQFIMEGLGYTKQDVARGMHFLTFARAAHSAVGGDPTLLARYVIGKVKSKQKNKK